MIVEWLLELSAGFNEWVASLAPAMDLPFDPEAPVADWGPFLSWTVGLGWWIDFTLLAAICAAAVGIWLAAGGVKLVRVLLSHVPFFGGRG